MMLLKETKFNKICANIIFASILLNEVDKGIRVIPRCLNDGGVLNEFRETATTQFQML